MDITTVVLMQLGTLGAAVAANRANTSGLRGRVARLERKVDAMPKDFMPRTESNLALKSIESNTLHTNSMIQALIYRGKTLVDSIEAEAEATARDFVQICITGVDGRGGLNRWEGRIPHLYLDNRSVNGVPAPLVTVGVGCALGLGEALTLPFVIDGRLATNEDIAADFAAVQSAPFGMLAKDYARYSRCRLPDLAIDELVRKRFAVFIPALRRLFPRFDSFPETAKAGCLDLIYGVGVAGLNPPHYPSFQAAANSGDWNTAALESGSNTHDVAYEARNKARQDLFFQAAEASGC